MNRNMVLAEWSRAREALRGADTLTRNRCYADGISRAYYAMLHAAKAALHIHDVTAESHAAVRRMFGLHLVRPGEIVVYLGSRLLNLIFHLLSMTHANGVVSNYTKEYSLQRHRVRRVRSIF
jgi:uncharacterized protein (UPF0332 family)